jgi:isobutyryl-CoA mutase
VRVARERQSLRISQRCSRRGPAERGLRRADRGQDASSSPARASCSRVAEDAELYAQDEYVVKIRDKEMRTKLTTTSLSGTKIRKVALPRFEDDGEILRFLLKENLPGSFPYHGRRVRVQARRRGSDAHVRRRGRRVPHQSALQALSEGHAGAPPVDGVRFGDALRLGSRPRPDIYGKVGNSGVSIATLDDMKVLYSGFDLCAPTTSVSMTINGPAPMILAMFMNTAIDQQVEKFQQNGRDPTPDEAQKPRRAWVAATVRGTVQADILKEDQGQNTCIFSTEFALKMMGDIQEYFVRHEVQNFYSVSISGYHIAEAGANPISQLAFTLANGFTYVEAYLARGMHVDDFAPTCRSSSPTAWIRNTP